MGEVSGLSISDSAIGKMSSRARSRLLDAAEGSQTECVSRRYWVRHEMGARLMGRNWWEWVVVGQTVMLYAIEESWNKKGRRRHRGRGPPGRVGVRPRQRPTRPWQGPAGPPGASTA